MFLRIHQAVFLLLGFLAAISYACGGGATLYPRGAASGSQAERRSLSLQRRDLGKKFGRGVCSLTEPKQDQPTKRELTLSKRTLVAFPPASDPAAQDAFMVEHTAAAQTVIIDAPDGTPDEGLNLNTAFFRPLDKALALEVSNLKGCGVIVVASEKAVYFSHFWEEESFPAELGEKEEHPVDDFNGKVIGLLNDGLKDTFKPGSPSQIQQALKAHADQFKGVQGAQAYLVMSKFKDDLDDKDLAGKTLYPTSADKMASEVKDLVGLDVVKRLYDVDGTGEEDITKSANGRVLFEYDPAGGNGDPAFRVIIQREEFFTQLKITSDQCVCNEDSCNFSCCASGTCPPPSS